MTEALSSTAEKRLVQFDGFLVDPVRRCLVRDGEVVTVTPKAFSILLVLLERRGEVVDKEELIRRIWPDTFVTEANLTQNVSALRKALGEKANEHRYVLTVPGKGYCFVAEVREAPAALMESLAAPEIALSSGVDIPMPPPSILPPRLVPSGRPARRIWLVAAVLVLLAAAAAAALLVLRQPSAAAAPAGKARPSLAVLSFENLSGAPSSEWLGPALAEMLTTELAAGGRVRMVSGENVARARLSAPAGSLDPESLRRLHRILGCERLVVGSYLPLESAAGARIRVDLRVLQLPSGDTVASLAEVGTEPELFELAARSGGRLRQALGLAELSPEQARAARALQPASTDAARLYSQGLASLRDFDAPRAVDLLRRAAAADPGSATIRSALAQAWATLGYDVRARQEAARAVALAGSLPRPERLAIEARAHQASRQWVRASEIYRTLWTFYPDDLEHGLQLARSLSEANRGAEALALIAELRKLPPPVREDPRIDLAEAYGALRLLDSARIVQAAGRAAAKGRASRETLVIAQALQMQGAGLLVKGEPAAAIPLFEEARHAFQQAGDALEMAATMAFIGISLQRQGDLAGAEKIFLEASKTAQERGNVSGTAFHLGNLGVLYLNQGDLKRALAVLDRSRARFAEVDDPLLEARILNASASVLVLQGDLKGARSRIEEVLSLSRKVGSRNDEARAYVNLAAVLAWKGEVREAGRLAREAFRTLRESDPAQAASALAAWADALARQGELADARQRYEQALALKRQAGDRIGTGQILGSLADLEHRAGNLAAARVHSREQLRIAEETGARTLRSWSYQGRGREELAAGDLPAARRSLETALAESSAAGEGLRAAAVRVELARLELAEGDAGAAARIAGDAAAWFREREIAGGESLSLSVQAEALARLGRAAEIARKRAPS